MNCSDKYNELLEQCNHNYEEMYSITGKKVAEYSALEIGTKEQLEEREMWKKGSSMVAGVIADIHMTQKGYRTKCINGAHGVYLYFAKPERKEEDRGIN